MRTFFTSVVCFGLLVACGCGTQQRFPTSITAPTVPTVVPALPIAFAERFTVMTVDEMVRSRVTTDDPPCVDFPEFRCQYFRLTAPRDGIVDVIITTTHAVSSQLQDISIRDSQGADIWGPVGGRVSIRIKAGEVYQVTVWYAAPGVEFELRSSLP